MVYLNIKYIESPERLALIAGVTSNEVTNWLNIGLITLNITKDIKYIDIRDAYAFLKQYGYNKNAENRLRAEIQARGNEWL